MREGDVVGGYLVVTKPTNENGGKCVWAFAERDGRPYFIKEFLDPKYPVEGSPGGERSKLIRRQECEAFEHRHRLVMERLKGNVPGGGNIVIAHEFLREGAVYYKITERIDPSNLDDLTPLSLKQQMVVLRTLALSVKQLHRIGIVHGDLKPSNVLVQRRPGKELYSAKLIDFDDSYVSGEPPKADDVPGDTGYGAPEWFSYIAGDGVEGTDLTCAVDMFALGLILHRYLAGCMPVFDTTRYPSVGEAVRAGAIPVPVFTLSTYMQTLVSALTVREPGLRPTIDEFLEALADEEVLDPARPAGRRHYRRRTAPPPPGTKPGKSRLTINVGTTAAPTAARPSSGSGPRPVPPPSSSSPPPAAPPSAPPADAGHPPDDAVGTRARSRRLRIRMDEPRLPEAGRRRDE